MKPPSSADRPPPTGSLPPPRWRRDIERVLLTRADISKRVRSLGREISRDLSPHQPLLIPLLSGTVLFTADLLRHLAFPLHLDFMGVSSYRSATQPGRLTLTKDLRLDVRNRDVLLIDDILDTGRTLGYIVRRLRRLRPRSLRTCVLLEKAVPRPGGIRPDYVGFRIPDEFVVGYGLDYAESYRNLPFIGVLRITV